MNLGPGPEALSEEGETGGGGPGGGLFFRVEWASGFSGPGPNFLQLCKCCVLSPESSKGSGPNPRFFAPLEPPPPSPWYLLLGINSHNYRPVMGCDQK